MDRSISGKKIILASKSPRRAQLLKEANLSFEIRAKDVDESYPVDLPALEVAEYLAIKKAEASQEFLESDDEILLAADSVVIVSDEILGKPKNKKAARAMLRKLSDKMHLVTTGVCLISKNKKHSFNILSKVYFYPLSDEEIDYYVENYKPFDKAGGYAIQEWIGWTKVEKIDGSYPNIIGLPVAQLVEALQSF